MVSHGLCKSGGLSVMALLRFDSDADPIGALLGLQGELEGFMRNPAFGWIVGP
jgi:hypothetical protein